MAGLVVIDFIDMEQGSHDRKVEQAMKDAVKNDRARIQVGRISRFGLMEMSRQRLRTGVLEASTRACPHCEGTGLMRTAASAGLAALRIIEDEAARGRGDKIVLRAGREAAVYVLNKKRAELADIESRYGVSIDIMIDESFEGARMTVESSGPRPVPGERAAPPPPELIEDEEEARRRRSTPPWSAPRKTKKIEERDEQERSSERGHARAAGAAARRGGRGRGSRDEEGGQPREAEPEAESGGSGRRSGRAGHGSRARGRGAAPSGAGAAAGAGEKPSKRQSRPTARRWSSGRWPRNRRSPKPRPGAAKTEVAPPQEGRARTRPPPEAPPAETADEAARQSPSGRARARRPRRRKQAAEPAPLPAANNDTAIR